MSMYYYYCKMGTFKSMLESKTLWLTDLTKSNDSQEVMRAYQNLWERVKNQLKETDIDKKLLFSQFEMLASTFQIQSVVDVPFGCCFCSEKDLVQQWKEYGENGAGVSVGFDLDSISGLTRQYPITSADITHAIGYEAVIYDSEQLEAEFTQICYCAIKQFGNKAWIMGILPTFKHYAGFIKNPTFRDEKETRIVYYPSEQFETSIPGLSGLETNVVPHYCLSWADRTTSAIRSITIGYNNHSNEKEIKNLLAMAGIRDEIKIFWSECSYRDRQHGRM